MYTVINGQRIVKFEAKEDLIRYFINQEPFFVLKRDPKAYVPSVFREVAMNHNDCYTVANPGDDFFPFISRPKKVRRTVMVYDGSNRVIDIRSWLPEFRAAAAERVNNANKYVWFGCSGAKPKFRNGYRVVAGLKEQSKCHKSWQRRSGQPSARKLHEDEWAKYLEEQVFSTEDEDADLLQAG